MKYYLLGLLLLLTGIVSSEAATIVTYTFDTANGVIGPKLVPTTTLTNVTASNITGSGTVTLAARNGMPSDLLAAAPTSGQATVSIPNTLTSGSYFSFTLTPDAGYTLSLTNITFSALTGGAAAPRAFYLFSDATGISNGNQLGTGIYQNTGGDTLTTTATSYDFSLSAAALQNLSTATQFRFYVQALNAGQNIAFDNIVINGTLTAVPEPTSIALLLGGIAVLGLLRKYGKKSATRTQQ